MNALEELAAIRDEVVSDPALTDARLALVHPHFQASARNLLHYLTLRRRDLRPLQRELASLGLSSLGRAESHVLANIDAVLGVLRLLQGQGAGWEAGPSPRVDLATGDALLAAHTEALLGPAREGRAVRIMVTMPGEAAQDPALVRELLECGMDCMRINCAHDDAASWLQMIEHLRVAEGTAGRRCKVVMDLAGPKLRTGPVEPDAAGGPSHVVLATGDRLIVTRDQQPGRGALRDEAGEVVAPATIGCTIPNVFDHVEPGASIWFDDGKIGGVIEQVGAGEVVVRITHARARGEKLRADKGLNLPDSNLGLDAMTEKDVTDLPCVAQHADVVELSFANTVRDVEELQARLTVLGTRQPAIVLKVETRRGFENLPDMLLAAMQSPCCGVMIARGDLAVECGFERLAEVQEEILWICEAAHVPVIWATQVLESLAKEGMASRAEITDAAMGHRAECVMLNKGPHVGMAVRVLDDILRRMEAHQSKKRSMLRELRLAHVPLGA
jgi:pyruvate kinase